MTTSKSRDGLTEIPLTTRHFVSATLMLTMLLVSGCGDDGHLRGYVTKSEDGKTYLAIVDDHNDCPIKVDGKDWTVSTGEPGSIAPGDHVIECYGGQIRFQVPEGAVFHFDYWGP